MENLVLRTVLSCLCFSSLCYWKYSSVLIWWRASLSAQWPFI